MCTLNSSNSSHSILLALTQTVEQRLVKRGLTGIEVDPSAQAGGVVLAPPEGQGGGNK